ncbi:MAG TPA: Rho termination factor N-terminal domain-containing protein [Pirellula sp.]|nr:Rho termination factor N-terminal domain-containing protein [Pirellula sp.]
MNTAKELAARVVNKRRRREGSTPNKTTQGTGNPNRRLENRTMAELRNIARQLKIEGRSELTRKEKIIAAIRDSRTHRSSK